MASLSSRRNSSSSGHSPSRRSSRMDSVFEEDGSTVFSSPPNSPLLSRSVNLLLANENGARNRSPSLPVATSPQHPVTIARSRSPSLPMSNKTNRMDDSNDLSSAEPSERQSRIDLCGHRTTNRSNSAYTDRSDSGISDCSHSSLLSSFSKPWLIHEEDETDPNFVNGHSSSSTKPNYSLCSPTGGSIVAEKNRDGVTAGQRRPLDSSLPDKWRK